MAELPILNDRQYVLARGLTYVFSLSISYELSLPDGCQSLPDGLSIPINGVKARSHHVLGDEVVRSAAGTLLEWPRCQTVWGASTLILSKASTVPFEGRLLFDIEGAAPLSLDHIGLLALTGGTSRINRLFHEPIERTALQPNSQPPQIYGSVRAAFRCTIDTARFRWLALNQLIGIGRVTIEKAEASNDLVIHTDFDLHVGF